MKEKRKWSQITERTRLTEIRKKTNTNRNEIKIKNY